jgi:hypothetical protein
MLCRTAVAGNGEARRVARLWQPQTPAMTDHGGSLQEKERNVLQETEPAWEQVTAWEGSTVSPEKTTAHTYSTLILSSLFTAFF